MDGPALLSLAVRFGTTRLIDNEPLDDPASRGRPTGLTGHQWRPVDGSSSPISPTSPRSVPRSRTCRSSTTTSGWRCPEIGLLTAIQAGTQLALAPVWGGAADRFPHTRLTLPLACAVAVAGGIALFMATTFATVLVGSMVLYAGLSGIGPTLDARTLETLGRDRHSRYAQVRAFGSLAFVISALLVGLVLDGRTSRDLFLIYLPALRGDAGRHDDDPPARLGPFGQRPAWRPRLRGRRVSRCSSPGSSSCGPRSRRSMPSTRSRSWPSVAIPVSSGSRGRSVPPSRFPSCTGCRGLLPGSGRSACSSWVRSSFAFRSLLARGRRGPGGARAHRAARGARVRVRVRWRGDGPRGTRPGRSRRDRPGALRGQRRAATIIGSIAGGTVAGILGIAGLFAVCGAVGLVGAGSWPSRSWLAAKNRTGPPPAPARPPPDGARTGAPISPVGPPRPPRGRGR